MLFPRKLKKYISRAKQDKLRLVKVGEGDFKTEKENKFCNSKCFFLTNKKRVFTVLSSKRKIMKKKNQHSNFVRKSSNEILRTLELNM